jgi:hypothetical protein
MLFCSTPETAEQGSWAEMFCSIHFEYVNTPLATWQHLGSAEHVGPSGQQTSVVRQLSRVE